jgi:hypothetical protein
MKLNNTKFITTLFALLALIAFSACGSSGNSSDTQLVGGAIANNVQAPTPYVINTHEGSTAIVHSHTDASSTHNWVQVSGPTVTLSNTSTPTVTFTVPTGAVQPIVLQHTVTGGGQTTTSIHLINPVPIAIKLAVIISGHKTIVSSVSSSLHASASGGDGSYLYNWTQTGGTPVSLNLTHPSTPTFTAPAVTKNEGLNFNVTVTDGQGKVTTSTYVVTVIPKPIPNPVAPAYPLPTPPTIYAHNLSTVVLTTVRSSGTHHWKQISGASVTLSTNTGNTVSFIVPSNATKKIIIEEQITDTQGNIASITHTVIPSPSLPALKATLSSTNTLHDGDKGIVHASITGGDGTYTYVWSQEKGSTIHLDESVPSAPTFIAPSVKTDEDIVLKLIVTDGIGTQITASQSITIIAPAPKQTPLNNVPVCKGIRGCFKPTIVTCPTDRPYALQEYSYSTSLKIDVEVKCANYKTCKDFWWAQTSDRDLCTNQMGKAPQPIPIDFMCSFCANKDTPPITPFRIIDKAQAWRP